MLAVDMVCGDVGETPDLDYVVKLIHSHKKPSPASARVSAPANVTTTTARISTAAAIASNHNSNNTLLRRASLTTLTPFDFPIDQPVSGLLL